MGKEQIFHIVCGDGPGRPPHKLGRPGCDLRHVIPNHGTDACPEALTNRCAKPCHRGYIFQRLNEEPSEEEGMIVDD